MIRKALKALPAWDVSACSQAVLAAGALLDRCRIRRTEGVPGAEPYLMEFESSGRRYTCPLFSFQPRTEAADAIATHAD